MFCTQEEVKHIFTDRRKNDIIIFDMKKNYEFHGGRTLAIDMETHRVDLYFGHATESPEESTELAQWVFESFEEGVKEHTDERFCVVINMSDLDDSTLPSEEAKAIYTKHLLTNETIDQFICVTRSYGMRMLIGLLVRISGRAARIKVVDNMKAAEEAFQNWQETQSA